MKNAFMLRGSAIAFGTALLVAAGSSAMADDEAASQDVDVDVEIESQTDPGALAMTVESGSTTLAEGASSELERVFTGTLPKVTVTDTREAEEVPEGANWYVIGTASDFTDEQGANTIDASHLGWSPQLVEGEGEGESYVEVGGDVVPSEPGLVDQELLYLANSAAGNAGGGEFSATAQLEFVVPADVTEGSYSSTITLSLFE